MWKRDPGVAAMIEHLDRAVPSRLKITEEDWACLPSIEKFEMIGGLPDGRKLKEAMMEQARECANDFSYAARNYFWITTKKKKSQLFSLWESQYLILDKYYELKAKGKAQKIIIIKARQLGCSSLIEAMIAWRAMFYPNTRAIVVSVDQNHSSYLFGYMLYIYDNMPWWLKPMQASRKEEKGLFFENEDPALRSRYPGMNSKVMVQWSNQYSGVGQGIAIDAAHCSEFTDYDEDDLEAIVNEDLGNSMADEPEVFGFMESTGRGAGGAAHKLWRACERRLDLGKWPKWYPLFLPSFFETTRVLAPPQGWSIQGPEIVMRERAKKEWLRCDNQACGRYRKVTLFGESTVGAPCPSCNLGALVPMVLNDDQCFWHQDNREQAEEQGEKAKKQWLQEQAVTGEEAFQVSGYVMFNDSCREWVGSTIDNSPRRKGKIYRETGEIHGAGGLEGRCYVNGCNVDHRHDETPYTEWEEPQPDRLYTIGVDVSEGIGQDYSVLFVNKIGRALGEPDEQVALWRDNHTKPKELAFYCNVIGLRYNQAMMCIEYNTYQTTGDDVVYVYQYPNVFRWKNKETINPLTHKWHWWTKVNTKAYLHQTAVDWLLSRAWVIRSANCAEEMTTYRKEEFDTRSFGAEEGFHDDELMCLPEGVMVTTSTGLKPIEDVQAGNLVLTHKGRFMPVTRSGARYEGERLYRIHAYGRPPLLLTGNHPMLLWEKYRQTRAKLEAPIRQKNLRWRTKATKQVCWNKWRDPKWVSIDSAGDSIKRLGTCSIAPSVVSDVEAVDIADYLPPGYGLSEKGDLVGFTNGGKISHTMHRVPRHIPVDKDFLRLLGYYLAEGGRGSHNIIFASHKREKPLRDWLQGYLERLGLHCGTRYHSPNGALLWCSSIPMHSFFKQFGQKDTKALPKWVEYLPPEKQREVLLGYLLGDGCFRRQAGAIQAVTVSPEASRQLFEMSLRCGWPASTHFREGQNGHLRQNMLEYSSYTSELIRNCIEPELLACKCPFMRKQARNSDKLKITDGYMVGQIHKIEEVPFQGTVYDITVAEDHSFVADQTIVSNSGMIALYCSHELDCDEVGRVRVPSLVEVQKPARYRCYCNSCRYGEAIDPDGKWPWVCDNPEREYRCPSCGSIRLVAVSLEIQQQASLGYEGLMSLMGKRPEGVACEPRMEDL